MNRAHTILSIFALIAVLFTGCIKDKHPRPDEPRYVAPKAVEVPVAPMGGTVVAGEPQTRALGPLDGISHHEVYMAYGESDAGSYDPDPRYTKALRGLITYGITVFQPLLFYPIIGGGTYYNNIYLRGFYPREGVTDFTGSNAGAREIIANNIHYTIDGQHDIMLSSLVRGNYGDPIMDRWLQGGVARDDATLRYEHLLARLSFVAHRNESWPETLKLTRIWVTGVSNKAVLDLSKLNTDPDVLVFEEPHDKEFEAYYNPEGLVLSYYPASAAFASAMIEPNHEFELKVEFNTGEIRTIDTILIGPGSNGRTINIIGDDPDVPTTTTSYDDIVKPGKNYMIDIYFNNLDITTTVSIEPWSAVHVGDDIWW